MATTTQRPTGAADPQLAALMARQTQLAEAIERRAAEVVRTWLLDHDRTWVEVDFTKTRPEPPFDGDDGLTAAVGTMPRRAFGSGLDMRGSFIVRLAELNGHLGRLHDDQTPEEQFPRIELVIVRDPDGGTAATMFLDGAELSDGDISKYLIDAGSGHMYSDWIESRDDAVEGASPAAAALLSASYDYPPGHQYIEGAPEGWPVEDGQDR